MLNPKKYRSTKTQSIPDAATRMAFEDMAQRIEQLARDANGLNTGGGGSTGDVFPSGAVVMWFGAEADIPAGWSVYEPARGRFFRMIASGGTPGTTGGSTTHSHELQGTMSGPNATVGVASGSSYNVATGTHTHGLGSMLTKSGSNLPPYIDGILIQKD